MTLATHPTTGLHYGVVITPTWGPLTDIRACYEEVARFVPWLTVVSPGQKLDYDDPTLFVLFWAPALVPHRSERRCTTALVYSEALDPDLGKLLPAHRNHFREVYEQCAGARYDGVFGHTPYMAELLALHLASHRVMTGVLPVGWEPGVMGRPRGTHRVHELVYHGSMVGRRHLLIPFLSDRLGHRLTNASGQYGRGLLGALEAAYGSLHIAHSPVASFSTWRLWQALAGGCAVVGEPGDSWPFEAGKHYAPIGPFTLDNAVELGDELARLLDRRDDLIRFADRALAELGHFTTMHCVCEYLVPKSLEMRRA